MSLHPVLVVTALVATAVAGWPLAPLPSASAQIEDVIARVKQAVVLVQVKRALGRLRAGIAAALAFPNLLGSGLAVEVLGGSSCVEPPRPHRRHRRGVAMSMVEAKVRQLKAKPGPRQPLSFPGGEALWAEAQGGDVTLYGAVTRGGRFYYVYMDKHRRETTAEHRAAFLATLQSIRP